MITGDARPPITLDDYDGWILGLAVTDDDQLVISGNTWGDTIRIFNAVTGAAADRPSVRAGHRPFVYHAPLTSFRECVGSPAIGFRWPNINSGGIVRHTAEGGL